MEVSVEEVVRRLGEEGFVVLDVRSLREYTGEAVAPCDPRPGRIPGARHLDVSELMGLPPDEVRARLGEPEGDIPFELGIDDLVVGDGAEAKRGSKVAVHYVGVSFRSGEEFDASWNRGQVLEFKLGKGQVIPGWDQGVEGMRVGGRRKLTIPSALAYGARGAGGVIEPHEPLVFVVDLLAVN